MTTAEVKYSGGNVLTLLRLSGVRLAGIDLARAVMVVPTYPTRIFLAPT